MTFSLHDMILALAGGLYVGVFVMSKLRNRSDEALLEFRMRNNMAERTAEALERIADVLESQGSRRII